MSTQPVYVFAKYQVKEENLAAVLPLLAIAAQKSREEKGNLFYRAHQSTGDAHTIVLFEGYKDEAALEEHRTSPHFQDIVVGQIVPLLESREVTITKALEG